MRFDTPGRLRRWLASFRTEEPWEYEATTPTTPTTATTPTTPTTP